MIGDEAKRAGISVKAFQELRYVADQNRVSIDALTDGIKEMNLRADEFIVTGAGSGSEAFKRLGFTATELAEKLKNPSALFTEIIGKLEKMDRAAQIRIADEVFGGTGGEQFVQLIDRGADGIRQTIEEANRLGIVMDEQMIAKAAEVDRQFGMLTTTVGVKLKGAIVEAATALSDLTNMFSDLEDRNLAQLQRQREAILAQRDAAQKVVDESRLPSFLMGPAESQLAKSQAALDAIDAAIAKVGERSAKSADEADKLTDANNRTADALDYVTRNGGAAATTVDRYGNSVADMKARLAEIVDGLQAQVDGFGLSEGAAAKLRFETEQLAAAQRAANAAGKESIDLELRAEIERRADAVGRLTQKLHDQAEAQAAADRRAGFVADIEFERSIAGRSSMEQAIASRLHAEGIAAGTAEYERLANIMRETNALNDVQIGGQKTLRKEFKETGNIIEDVFGALISGAGSGEKAIDSLLSTFARIGQANAQQGLSLLSNWLMGGSASAPQPAPYAAPQYASSYHRSAGTALPPIATGEGFNAGRAASVASRSVPAQIWNFFAGKGLSSHQIAGILGNAKAESGFNFGNSSGDGGNAWGLFQWNDRRRNMVNFVGQDWRNDLSGQLDFAWHELQTSESKAYRALLKATDVVQATEAFLGFERPSGYPSGVRNSHNYSGRVKFAQDAYREFGTTDMITAVSQGTIDANRRMVSGEVPGIDAWAGYRKPGMTYQEEVAGISAPQGMSQLGAGMQALGAGFGAFAAGAQSGSPIMGALQGALGGFSTGASLGASFASIGAVGGPIGAAVGGIAGPTGGTFGKSKRRAA